jgi:hypothetical protein
MPIDLARVVGAGLPTLTASWTPDDVILYHLGLGAGVPPTDTGELRYTLEDRLVVLPSFAVIPAFDVLRGLARLEGFEVDLAMLLHGEQEVELSAPLSAAGEVSTSARVTNVFDKGKGAVVVVETTSTDADGTPLFINRFTSFVRGEGWFGGKSGPAAGNEPPGHTPTSWSSARHCRNGRCCTASAATATRCTLIRRTPCAVVSNARSCTGCAASASPAKRSSTRRSTARLGASRATVRDGGVSLLSRAGDLSS